MRQETRIRAVPVRRRGTSDNGLLFSSQRTSGTNYKYPLGCGQAIWLCSKARGGKIVDYLTDEQRSYGDKEPLELGADLQFGPLVLGQVKWSSLLPNFGSLANVRTMSMFKFFCLP
jgi:hypothetical protein